MKTHSLVLTSSDLETIQDGLAALRGLYEVQVNYGRDDDGHWTKKLCAVEAAAQSIGDQTGVVLVETPRATPRVAPY